MPEIEMHESDTESDDDGYDSEVGSVGEVGEDVGVDGLDPFYPCHGVAGSSINVDGRCVICRQPSAFPAAMHVKRTATGVQIGISYRVLSAEDEPSPDGWFFCHQEDCDAPEESCLVCGHSLRGPASCLRLSGKKEWIPALVSLRMRAFAQFPDTIRVVGGIPSSLGSGSLENFTPEAW
ncbi:hypothetical protein TSAR_014163 [Trichomalopsis sarcophagae]|uniref:Uncharacterized protein n=1 Tax=Trichomalopsis sarcophagae TaxID=543379 RepID=A0A232EIG6_9HYME|nr:hypothetical protein TSAR_014163 [Trichomalopsis sarcophagae]